MTLTQQDEVYKVQNQTKAARRRLGKGPVVYDNGVSLYTMRGFILLSLENATFPLSVIISYTR